MLLLGSLLALQFCALQHNLIIWWVKSPFETSKEIFRQQCDDNHNSLQKPVRSWWSQHFNKLLVCIGSPQGWQSTIDDDKEVPDSNAGTDGQVMNPCEVLDCHVELQVWHKDQYCKHTRAIVLNWRYLTTRAECTQSWVHCQWEEEDDCWTVKRIQ